MPVKYLACLVNLEGQFDDLLPEAPARTALTTFPVRRTRRPSVRRLHAGGVRPQAMGMQVAPGLAPRRQSPRTGRRRAAHRDAAARTDPAVSASSVAGDGSAKRPDTGAPSGYTQIGADVSSRHSGGFVASAPVSSSPSTRCSASRCSSLEFHLVRRHDLREAHGARSTPACSARPRGPTPTIAVGREPLEIAETGHVGLGQRTRRGDQVRSWYRGPLSRPTRPTSPTAAAARARRRPAARRRPGRARGPLARSRIRDRPAPRPEPAVDDLGAHAAGASPATRSPARHAVWDTIIGRPRDRGGRR